MSRRGHAGRLPFGRTLLMATLSGSLAACGDREGPAQPPPSAVVTAEASRPVRDVLDAKLAGWGLVQRTESYVARELRADIGVLPPSAEDASESSSKKPSPPEDSGSSDDSEADGTDHRPASEVAPLDADLVELRDGLVGMVLGNPRQLMLAQGDVANLAEEMIPVLLDGLNDRSREAGELKVLIDLASAAPSGEIAVALSWLASEADQDWLRRYAAYGIQAHAKAPGADAAIPQLFFRLKYEKDAEAVGWVAQALQALGAAAAVAKAETAATGLVNRAPLDLQLQAMRLVESTEKREMIVPSEGLLKGTWLWISELSGEHFQLRGVDDGRFVLSSFGPWAAEVFAEALEDDDAYVRLHVAQVLERMGPRGAGAVASLTEALRDGNEGVRGTAADALVAVAGQGAQEPLLTRLTETRSHADRVAIARALSMLPGERPTETLRELFESTTASDLKLAAAEGLLLGGEEAAVLPWLARELTAPIGDRAGAETTLTKWIHGLDPKGRGDWIQAWDSHGPKGSIIHRPDQVRTRRSARAEWLAANVIPTWIDEGWSPH